MRANEASVQRKCSQGVHPCYSSYDYSSNDLCATLVQGTNVGYSAKPGKGFLSLVQQLRTPGRRLSANPSATTHHQRGMYEAHYCHY